MTMVSELGMAASLRAIPRRPHLSQTRAVGQARVVSHFGGTTAIAALWTIPGAACSMSTAERRRALNGEE